MKKEIIILMIIIFVILGITSIYFLFGYEKQGIVCSDKNPNIENPRVSLETIREKAPEEFGRVKDTLGISCVNYTILNRYEDVVCEACGWICASQDAYFWKFRGETNADDIDISIWQVQCEGNGLMYTQGEKKNISMLGYKI